jgi:hypothetical protein
MAGRRRRADGQSSYLAFRAETMFGPGGGRVSGEELVGYLEWCRWARSLTR